MSCIASPCKHSIFDNIGKKCMLFLNWNTLSIRTLYRCRSINMHSSGMRNMLLSFSSNMNSCTNASLKWCYLVVSNTTRMLLDDWKNNINLQAEILPASGTGKRRILAWHHNLCSLMLGTRCNLEILERVLTEHRNPKEMQEAMASGFLKDASNCSVSTVSEDGFKTIIKDCYTMVNKNNLIPWFI